jgi:KDO2-lipid IV(A) lauroyltransferase
LSAAANSGEQNAGDVSLARFWAPRYWPTWLLLGAMRAAARLPMRAQLAIGRALGRTLLRFKRRQREIARRNLELCFPELTPEQRADLLVRHFDSLGMSFIEVGVGWFTPIDDLLRRVSIEGREHLERALASQGVLIVSAHFTTLEVGIAILEALVPNCAGMYRPQRDELIDAIVRRGRSRFAKEQIPRDNIRALVRGLRDKRGVLYLPDQTYVGRQTAILPFFGEPALTNSATGKLAEMGNAAVLTYFFRRLPGDAGYRIDIGPPLPGVPSRDSIADSRALFGRLESYIRLAPEQYLWIYKKFKGRPPPFEDPYAGDGSAA